MLDDDSWRDHQHQAFRFTTDGNIFEQTAHVGEFAQKRRTNFVALFVESFDATEQDGSAVRHAHGRGDGGKGIGLQQDIDALKLSIRETILSDYLGKCMWLDKEAGRLGNLVLKNDKADFVTLDSDGPELSSFLVVLEKDHYGDYVMDFREFARVLPKITKSTPWVGPTLHIYSESYRKEFGLEEYYSLYNGFRTLTSFGTPVVLLEGQDPLTQPSEVRYITVSHRSANVLQGRILDGDVLKEGVRDFTTRELVWKQ